MPNITVIVTQVSIAASLPIGRRPRMATGHRLWVEFLPEKPGGHDIAG